MMPSDFELPADLADSVDVIYLDDDDEFEDNLESVQEEQPVVDDDDDTEAPADKALLTFKEHTRGMFCVSFNHAGTLVVTGGEDDIGYVFRAETGEVYFECTGHKDSVTCASFSYDDKYVVTGDMSGIIQVWDVATKLLVWCYEGDEIEWLIWHHSAPVLFCGVQSGEIYMWQIPQNNCKVLATSGSKCTAGILLPNGTQMATSYADGCVKIWDLKTTSVVCQVNEEVTGGSVTGLTMSADGKLLITCGSTSGAIVLKTADCKVVIKLQPDDNVDIEAAAFCTENDLPLVATGNLIGEINFWDISHQALRHKTQIEYSVTKMIWGPNSMVFVSSIDGVVYVYSGRNGKLLTTLTGHRDAILDMQLSKDSKFLITCSDDFSAKIFDVEKLCTSPC